MAKDLLLESIHAAAEGASDDLVWADDVDGGTPARSQCRCITSRIPSATAGSGAITQISPRREHGLAVDVVAVGEREREGRWATDDLALRVVLRAVARAHVLVGSTVPRHNAAQVRAHSVECEIGRASCRERV